jgi:hypothetical protein
MWQILLRRLGIIRVNNMTFLGHHGHSVQMKQDKFYKAEYLGGQIHRQPYYRNGMWCNTCNVWVMSHDTKTDT